MQSSRWLEAIFSDGGWIRLQLIRSILDSVTPTKKFADRGFTDCELWLSTQPTRGAQAGLERAHRSPPRVAYREAAA